MLWHSVKLLIGLDLVELFANCPLLNLFQLDVVVESIAAVLVAAEFVVVIVAVFGLVLVDFAAVAAAGLDSEQLVEQAEEGPFRVVELDALIVDAAMGSMGNEGGLGSVLYQADDHGKLHVIAYASCALSKHKKIILHF
jgi:hypothetical protein